MTSEQTQDHDDIQFLNRMRGYTYEQAYFRKKKHEDAKKVFQQWCNIGFSPEVNLFDAIHAYFMKNYRNAEYHDWYHTCCMIVNCAEGYQYSALNLVDGNLTERVNMNSLLLAAAFHDIGHSGGTQPDAFNVSVAVALCTDFMMHSKINTSGTDRSSVDKNIVLDLIQVTQYPFKLEPKTTCEQIIRDADLLQILEPTWYDVIYGNLFAEVNRSRQMNYDAFCIGQTEFLSKATFYSRWFFETKANTFNDCLSTRTVMVLKR